MENQVMIEVDLEKELIDRFREWNYVIKNGSISNIEPDGYRLSEIRQEILDYKRQIEEIYGNDASTYPDIYFRNIPPSMPLHYMAKADVLRERSPEIYQEYLENSSFQYILSKMHLFDSEERKELSIDKITDYVYELRHAIKVDDLCRMKKYVYAEDYFEQLAIRVMETTSERVKEMRRNGELREESTVISFPKQSKQY